MKKIAFFILLFIQCSLQNSVTAHNNYKVSACKKQSPTSKPSRKVIYKKINYHLFLIKKTHRRLTIFLPKFRKRVVNQDPVACEEAKDEIIKDLKNMLTKIHSFEKQYKVTKTLSYWEKTMVLIYSFIQRQIKLIKELQCPI